MPAAAMHAADQAAPSPRSSGGGEWSEVPPELEEQLRAQLAQSAIEGAQRDRRHP